jgi:hypothetical protein
MKPRGTCGAGGGEQKGLGSGLGLGFFLDPSVNP